MAIAGGRTHFRVDFNPPLDRDIASRNRWTRRLNFVVTVFLLYGIPIAFFVYKGTYYGYPVLGHILGFAVGQAAATWIVPSRMLVRNSKYIGLVTIDWFTNRMVVYGPGLHLKHWWEEVDTRDNFPLDVITERFAVVVPTATSRLTFPVMLQCMADLARLDRTIGLDAATISQGFPAFVKNMLTRRCVGQPAALVHANYGELNDHIAGDLMRARSGHEDPTAIGDAYGLIVVAVVVEEPEFAEGVQRSRNSVDIAAAFNTTVARQYGLSEVALAEKLQSGAIPIEDYNKMLNRAIGVSGAVDMKVSVFDTDIPAIAGEIFRRWKGVTA